MGHIQVVNREEMGNIGLDVLKLQIYVSHPRGHEMYVDNTFHLRISEGKSHLEEGKLILKIGLKTSRLDIRAKEVI